MRGDGVGVGLVDGEGWVVGIGITVSDGDEVARGGAPHATINARMTERIVAALRGGHRPRPRPSSLTLALLSSR
jgi:hypothetical protein